MFPTAYSTIYRNGEGEVLGWDNGPSFADEEYGEDFYLEMEYEDRFYFPDDDSDYDSDYWDSETDDEI